MPKVIHIASLKIINNTKVIHIASLIICIYWIYSRNIRFYEDLCYFPHICSPDVTYIFKPLVVYTMNCVLRIKHSPYLKRHLNQGHLGDCLKSGHGTFKNIKHAVNKIGQSWHWPVVTFASLFKQFIFIIVLCKNVQLRNLFLYFICTIRMYVL